STTPSSPRRPFHGSCHCGRTRYVTYLTLPPTHITATPPSITSTVRIRKCNCSTCHKMSLFHVRVPNSPEDFVLLSPLNPLDGGLSDYTCFDGNIHWLFCGKCGVRCFSFEGEAEIREVEIDGKIQQAWAPKREGWSEGTKNGCYLSINAITIEPGQEGFDLKEWHEKEWISYLDIKDETGKPRMGVPYPGGMY
ncbi:hypothetical protein BGZ60DRAFT_344433, partial [Tricladium varicosporioides]